MSRCSFTLQNEKTICYCFYQIKGRGRLKSEAVYEVIFPVIDPHTIRPRLLIARSVGSLEPS